MNPDNARLGWIMVQRSLKNDQRIWQQWPEAWFKIWWRMVLEMNYKDNDWFDGGRTIRVPRGSLVTSIRGLADRSGTTVKQIRAAFKRFQSENRAIIVGGTHYTLVSITNYESYLGEDETQGTAKGTTKAQPGHNQGTTRATLQECKNSSSSRKQESDEENTSSVQLTVTPQNGNGAASSQNPDCESDDDDESENPSERLKQRLLKRHGKSHDADRTAQVIRRELDKASVALDDFLQLDKRVTQSPEKLRNPDAHYRVLARELAVKVKTAAIAGRMFNMENLIAESERQHKEWWQEKLKQKTCGCNDGLLPDGSFCTCKVGAFAREGAEVSTRNTCLHGWPDGKCRLCLPKADLNEGEYWTDCSDCHGCGVKRDGSYCQCTEGIVQKELDESNWERRAPTQEEYAERHAQMLRARKERGAA